jgi:hypothetical protein
MALARVQFISVSLDGFATGEGQTLDAPFGHAGERLHEYMQQVLGIRRARGGARVPAARPHGDRGRSGGPAPDRSCRAAPDRHDQPRRDRGRAPVPRPRAGGRRLPAGGPARVRRRRLQLRHGVRAAHLAGHDQAPGGRERARVRALPDVHPSRRRTDPGDRRGGTHGSGSRRRRGGSDGVDVGLRGRVRAGGRNPGPWGR